MTNNMTANKALTVKDATIKSRILGALPDGDQDLRDKVLEAFDDASKAWKNTLEYMIGSENAKRVFEVLEQDIPQQDIPQSAQPQISLAP